MGKVGSSTVFNSLDNLDIDMDIFQIHVLTDEWIKKVQDQYRHASRIHKRVIIDEHLLASLYLRRRMDKNNFSEKWKVISLVRDPIARNISTFFQAYPIYFAEFSRENKLQNDYMKGDISELTDLFMNSFEEHDTPLNWFDVHMKPAFGIDVFASEFPKEKGYKIYKGKDVDLLLVRLENLKACAAEAFRHFLGIEGFTLLDANISSDKDYSAAYNQFKKAIVLSEAYINSMYNSKFTRHFYTDNEIKQFKQIWGRI